MAPMMHLIISEILSSGAYLYLMRKGKSALYNQYVMELTGCAALLTVLALLPFARRDEQARKRSGLISPREKGSSLLPFLPLLALMGAGLCQYGNILISLCFSFLPQGSYYNDMAQVTNGQPLWAMLLWIGIIGPLGEEYIFRRMLFCRLRDRHGVLFSVFFSGLIFGIYHGNLLQAVYATLLGSLFALAYEYTGSFLAPVILHMSANCWGIILSLYLEKLLYGKGTLYFLLLSCLLIFSNIGGWRLFGGLYKKRGKTRLA